MSLDHPAKLTSLSHGGGCGCKISSAILARLLENIPKIESARLLTGNQTNDDAAVYRINDNRLMVATTDFFPPMVDDPFDFGCIAAANALSDIYAMGATPAVSLNLLGMPLDKVSEETVKQVLLGGQEICEQANCVIGGGHSIDSSEPFYGLACIGFVAAQHIQYNATAQAGNVLILSKPLGVGVLSSAFKQKRIDEQAYQEMLHWTTKLNTVGATIAQQDGVCAMSDVTGFGLLGHLMELCKPTQLHARLRLDDIPYLAAALELAEQGIITGASARNFTTVEKYITLPKRDKAREMLLTDPQTNGGLLIACAPEVAEQVIYTLHENGFPYAAVIGTLESAKEPRISVC